MYVPFLIYFHVIVFKISSRFYSQNSHKNLFIKLSPESLSLDALLPLWRRLKTSVTIFFLKTEICETNRFLNSNDKQPPQIQLLLNYYIFPRQTHPYVFLLIWYWKFKFREDLQFLIGSWLKKILLSLMKESVASRGV